MSRLPPIWTNGYKSAALKLQTEKPGNSGQESSLLKKSSVLLSKGINNLQKYNKIKFSIYIYIIDIIDIINTLLGLIITFQAI